MQVVVITPPEPWGEDELALVKRHLRVDSSDDDDLIAAYVAAALAHIDGPAGWLGRAIGVQTLEYRADAFACDFISLPMPPVLEIVSVTYDAGAGDVVLPADSYTTDQQGLWPVGSWPNAKQGRGLVRIRYRAGYETLPAPIRAAVMLMVGDLYANRETGVVGTVSAEVKMSTTVEALLSPFRIWSL